MLNRGFSGYTSAYNKLILPQILQCDNSPQGCIVAAVVLLGSNDAVLEDVDARGVPLPKFVEHMTSIIQQLIDALIPPDKIILLSPPPVCEEKYKQHCTETGERQFCSDIGKGQHCIEMDGDNIVLGWVRDNIVLRWVRNNIVLRWVRDNIVLRWARDNTVLRWVRDTIVLRWVRDNFVLIWARDNTVLRWMGTILY